MIGTIAGDIIGSPYVNNPLEDSTRIFFPLFDASERVEVNGRRATMRSYAASRTEVSRTVAAAVDWMMRGERTADSWLDVAEGLDLDPRRPQGGVLAACVPVVRLSGSVDEAVRSASVLVSAARPASSRAEDMKAAMDFVRFAWSVREAGNMPDGLKEARRVLEAEGYDFSRNTSELSPFVRGTVVQLSPGRLGPGDGKTVRDPQLVIPAVWAVLNESRSWEEAVRRGVAVGGDSALTGALAGGVAAMRWDIPEEVAKRAKDYLDEGGRELANRYGRMLSDAKEQSRSARLGAEENRFSVIRTRGLGSVYVIPEDRQDMEEAVRRLNRKAGRSEKAGDYAVIRPEEMEATLARLSRQVDAAGNVLDGTYLEHPRPEVRHLWLQEGEVRSAFSRSGEAVDGGRLPSPSTRQATRNAFEALKADAEGVRTELERKAGFGMVDVFAQKMLDKVDSYADQLSNGEGWNEDTSAILSRTQELLEGNLAGLSVQEVKAQVAALCGDNPWMHGFLSGMDDVERRVEAMEGAHVHFASAFYPVVMSDSIEIREGDTLRARVFVDDDGRFRLDTNAKTGGVHVEGIDGVLATMNLIHFPKPETPSGKPLSDASKMDIVRDALRAWCLDEGRIEDDDERVALEEDDAGKVYDEARAVRKKYRSNIDRAMDDLGLELGIAERPVGPVLTQKAVERREERRSESEERYAGLDRQGAIDSQAHKGSVFTIGHSNLSREEFDALLRRHGIEVLVDVRSYPRSKFCPHFNKESLRDHSEETGVEYHYFPELGGHRFVGEGKDRRELSYEECIAQKDFQKAMKDIRDCVKDGYRVALMCSENDPMDCHRMVMLGRALAHPEMYDRRLRPVDVQHITRTGYTLSQEHFERKLMKDYGLDRNPDEASQMLVSVAVAAPENIFSGGSSLARELTNVGNEFPITFRGADFVNSEHAYQTWKTGAFDPDGYAARGGKVDKPVRGDTFALMTEIIREKLTEYPDLVDDVRSRGGARWLLSCRHDVTGDAFWESAGKDGFIKALANAYMDVTGSDERRIGIDDSLVEYRKEPVRDASLVQDPTFDERLSRAYQLRGAALQEKDSKRKGVSLKRTMMSRQAKGGYRPKR